MGVDYHTIFPTLGGRPLGVRSFAASTVIEDEDVEVGTDPEAPTICFSKRVTYQLEMQWSQALIIKVIGAKHSYNYLLLKLRHLWSKKLRCQWTLMDIDNATTLSSLSLMMI